MALNDKQLQKHVNQIKVYLAFMTRQDQKMVLDEVNQQLLQGKCSLPASRYRISKLDADTEVFEFLLSLPLENLTQKDCVEKCLEKFGESRTPKKSAMSRHWLYLNQKRKELYD